MVLSTSLNNTTRYMLTDVAVGLLALQDPDQATSSTFANVGMARPAAKPGDGAVALRTRRIKLAVKTSSKFHLGSHTLHRQRIWW